MCANLADKMQADDAHRLGNIATIFSIGGAAMVAAGVVLWLTAPAGSETHAPGVAVAPGAGPSFADMTMVGRFE